MSFFLFIYLFYLFIYYVCLLFFFLFSLTSLSRLFQLIRDVPIGRRDVNGEYPEKKHLAHPQTELGLSHMCPVWGLNPHQTQRRDARMVKCGNEISALLTTRPRGPPYVLKYRSMQISVLMSPKETQKV